MVALSQFSSYLFTPSSTHFHQPNPNPNSNFLSSSSSSCFFPFKNRHCYARHSILCLASTRKSRPSRKLMSDEELCDALREFVSSVGLPENHVPSAKDLSKHGRKDLSNIVRRRGHKVIKELLSNSSETVVDGPETVIDTSDLQKNLNDKSDGIYVNEETDDLHGDLGSNFLVEGESQSSGDKFNESEPMMHNEVDVRHMARVVNKDDFGLNVNGTPIVQSSSAPSTMSSQIGNRHQTDSESGVSTKATSLSLEGSKMENEVQINLLKDMLHQKELELSQLKEEIEKEKQTLELLQSKAESEISKAQMLISEKDAELLAAEESLSGLVEAKIQYSGEGQTVEVAGSFNGWHQRLKMEPLPASTLLEPIGTRNPMLWSTTLWLYPGVYEIKFIVDGHWKIDPQGEITARGGMENNLLRVSR